MPNTIVPLLSRCLDYAGLFPPAALGVEEALRQFRAEQSADVVGMLSRFVCPAPRLEEVVATALRTGTSLTMTVLPRGGRSAGDFLANLETDLTAIHRTAQPRGEAAVTIDTIEVRPPADALEALPLRKLVAATDALVANRAPSVRQIFVELAPGEQLAGQLAVLVEQRELNGPAAPSLGYKLRTGSGDAATTPTAAQIAQALAAVARLGLQMKCTGGLHRPLRTTEGLPVHGFVNLLVAASLAATGRIGTETLAAVLEETSAEAFTFAADSLVWRMHMISTTEITAARAKLLPSFGSCYVDIPRTELQRLGWLPKQAAALHHGNS